MTKRSCRAAAVLITGAVLAGCAGGDDDNRAEVEILGTDPGAGAPAAAATGGGGGGGAGVIDRGGYQVAIAAQGDTVATLAQRIGLSPSELAAYNGLQPSSELVAGDELVVPEGQAVAAAAMPAEPVAALPSEPIPATPLPPAGSVESAPLGAPAAPAPQPSSIELAVAPMPAPGPGEGPTAPGNAPAPAPAGDRGWSPDLAAAAIDRAEGTAGAVEGESEDEDEDEGLPPPPSAAEPLPPAPVEPRKIESPEMARYQTGVDLPTPFQLTRPVEGQVAIPFNTGAGPQRNEGVDFAAPAGAPVVAAEDGEVALVSESLGGLGTIVLVRHPNDMLTVYGRLDEVRVTKGDYVERGQRIGSVASAPAGTEPRMHFEVRQGAESIDPMSVL